MLQLLAVEDNIRERDYTLLYISSRFIYSKIKYFFKTYAIKSFINIKQSVKWRKIISYFHQGDDKIFVGMN